VDKIAVRYRIAENRLKVAGRLITFKVKNPGRSMH
jgi:hypothetical protein